jgi:ABC-type amino acid transport substrate-binding protein
MLYSSEADVALAKLIADELQGRFWQVTAGDWWVVIEGVSSQKLVLLTNDPFGIAFTPRELTIGLKDLKERAMAHLQTAGIVGEDGSWRVSLAS